MTKKLSDQSSRNRNLDDEPTPGRIEVFRPTLPSTGLGQRIANYRDTKLAESEARLIQAQTGRIQALVGAAKAANSLDQALAELHGFDGDHARKKIQKRNQIEDIDLDRELEAKQEQLRLDREARQRARNPEPVKKALDPDIEAIRKTFRGSGKGNKEVDRLEKELIKKRGGREKLTPEDNDRIRNARQHASNVDQSKRGR